MNKILWIIFLGLLLSGNSYADKSFNNMLEICADDRFAKKTLIKEFATIFYLENPKYQELQKEYNYLKNKEKERSKTDQFKIDYENWKKANPRPQPKIIAGSNYKVTYEQYRDDTDKWLKKSNTAMTDILESLDDGTQERIKMIENETVKFIRSQALKYIKTKDFNLRFKAKEINGYVTQLSYCERDYTASPISFELKWSE